MNTNTNNIYRDVTMDNISEKNVGETVRIAGWIENIRDHGGVSFIDLRDMYGVMQVVMRDTSLLEGLNKEDCISVEGPIEHRDEETYNPKIPTGTIELEAKEVKVLGKTYRQLPFEVMTSKETREDVRLKYRYLDLRNTKVKDNMIFRSNVISYLRQKMTEMGFLEIQTPILCASSPEGARDYIVPSRKFKGKFYALPQAPQQYKQLLLVSGFDKYFQIAPCFRDEDARADRSPGEFYQLDFEMSFATQEDVFRVGLYVSSSLCSIGPSTEIQSSLLSPSRSDVSRITTCITPYISLRSINDTPPWSRMFSIHPAIFFVSPTFASLSWSIVTSR